MVDLARAFGVSELMIGLTIVAVGTSLPELVKAADNGTLGQETDEETKRTTYWVVLNEEIQN